MQPVTTTESLPNTDAGDARSPAETSPSAGGGAAGFVEVRPDGPRAFDGGTGISARLVKRLAKRIGGVLVVAGLVVGAWLAELYAIPMIVGFYVFCGAIDVGRHRPLTYAVVDSYFFGKGVLTWLLSPFNLLMDVLSLPYRNKGIYRFEDLPELHRRELTELLDAARGSDLIEQLRDKIRDDRSMLFFRWYGRELPATVDVPAFCKEYETIRTVGVSIFNKRKSTSWHFGPLRATFRVLYNLRPTPDNAAFIQVGDRVHYWNNEPLFIFDDTLMHQSVNESDHVRYCMFIDIVRPNKIKPVMDAIVAVLQVLLIRINRTFYKRWVMIK
ncbi:MAG: aspartyl/asparaginyl beta-hydroxylase domain-containing protein [Planctomycetota bacterium]